MKRRQRMDGRYTLTIGSLLVIGVAFLGYRSAQGATGDLVATVNFALDCSSGIGVGIAFDGQNLWYSCAFGSSPDLHRADPNTGAVTASYTVRGGLGALSYDKTRNVIWAGYGGSPDPGDSVVRIDLDAGQNVVGSAIQFNNGDFCGLDDGLAFDANNVGDPNDDVIYYSDDCFTTIIDIYDLTGALVGPIAFIGPGVHNSGLAVGGQLLYEAGVFENTTYVVDKSTNLLQFQYSTAVGGDPNFHPEDMECDTSTFAALGKHVMWTKEAYSPMRAHAFEIPFGSCGEGGVPAACGDGNLDPGEECDDGNTTNGDGCSSTCKIENEPPDCSAAAASLAELWPPNHKFRNVTVNGVTDPDGDVVTITITGVSQDEPLNGLGDGNTCPDAVIGAGSVDLRAERTGTSKDGRVYHVAFTADDGNGGKCKGSVTVCVPHDQRPGHVCVDQGPLYDSTACP